MDNSKEKEILRRQLELLAERSKNCDEVALADITSTMIALFYALSSNDFTV